MECPVCFKLFKDDEIARHTATHFDEPPTNITKPESKNKMCPSSALGGVFAHMMQRSREEKTRGFFGLNIGPDGSLYPTFSFNDPRSPEIGRNVHFESHVTLSNFAQEDRQPLVLVLHSETMSLKKAVPPRVPHPTPKNPIKGMSVTYLKSALQKGIRRARTESCVRITALLLGVISSDARAGTCCFDCRLPRECADEVLRRLPIIALEDAALHPAYPLLVWAMCVHGKGFELPDVVVTAVLGAVEEICSLPYLDTLPSDETLASPSEAASSSALHPSTHAPSLSPSASSGDPDAMSLSPPQVTTDRPRPAASLIPELGAAPAPLRTVVAAMLIRACYGGLPGDVRMVRGFARLWLARGATRVSPEVAPVSTLQCTSFDTQLYHSIDRAWQPLLGLGEELPSVKMSRESLLNLSLRREDLLTWGCDMHCDSGVIPHIMAACLTQGISVDDAQLRSVVWTFSAGHNVRRIYALLDKHHHHHHHHHHQQQQQQQHHLEARVRQTAANASVIALSRKAELAPIWRHVAKALSVYQQLRTDTMWEAWMSFKRGRRAKACHCTLHT